MDEKITRRTALKRSSAIIAGTVLLSSVSFSEQRVKDAWEYASELAEECYSHLSLFAEAGISTLGHDIFDIKKSKGFSSGLFYIHRNKESAAELSQICNRFESFFGDDRAFVKTLGIDRFDKAHVCLSYDSDENNSGAHFEIDKDGLYKVFFYPARKEREGFTMALYERSADWKKTSYSRESESLLFPVSIKSLGKIGTLEIPWNAEYKRESWKIVEESGLSLLHEKLIKKIDLM